MINQDQYCNGCNNIINKNKSAYICSTCGKHQHIECWLMNGQCTTSGCDGIPLDSRLTCNKELRIEKDKLTFCPKCGQKLSIVYNICCYCGHSLIDDDVQTLKPASPTILPSVSNSSINNSIRKDDVPAGIVKKKENGLLTLNSLNVDSSIEENLASFSENIINNVTSVSTERNLFEQSKNLSFDIYSEYLKKNRQYYMRAFQEIISGKHTFNWSAFIRGEYWFFYRKMIGYGWLYLGIESLILIVYFLNTYVGLLVMLIINIILGFYANNLYKYHVDKKVKSISKSFSNKQHFKEAIIAKRDVSVWLAIGNFTAAYFGIALIVAFIGSLF